MEGTSKKLFFGLLLSVVLFACFVFAIHVTVSPTVKYVLEDVSTLYNVSINNSDSFGYKNITQVNMTFPSSFTFSLSTNGSNARGTFIVSDNVLSWTNFTYNLVNGTNATLRYFWFNATAQTPGDFNITVATLNTTGVYYSNISMVVNDTTAPGTVDYGLGSPADGANLSDTSVIVNVSAVDNGLIQNILIRLYNSTRTSINSTNISVVIGAASGSSMVNFSGLPEGTYYFNATVNDTFGYSNATLPTRIIRLDKTVPIINLSAPANGVSSTADAYNFTFNVTDSSTISNCSVIVLSATTITTINYTGGENGIYVGSFPAGSYDWSINCTDTANNVANSSSRSFIVLATAASTADSSGGSGTTGITYNPGEKLVGGYELQASKNTNVNFNVGSEKHILTLTDVTSTTVKIRLASNNPIVDTLVKGQMKEYDVNVDGVYDLSVFVKDITGSKATLVLKSITKQVPVQEASQQAGKTQTGGEAPQYAPVSGQSSSWVWVVAVLLVVVVIVIVVTIAKKKGKSPSQKKFH